MTDFQRLRRNVLREIDDDSAPHRMLFSYAKMELRYGIHFWWPHNGVGPGPNLGNYNRGKTSNEGTKFLRAASRRLLSARSFSWPVWEHPRFVGIGFQARMVIWISSGRADKSVHGPSGVLALSLSRRLFMLEKDQGRLPPP